MGLAPVLQCLPQLGHSLCSLSGVWAMNTCQESSLLQLKLCEKSQLFFMAELPQSSNFVGWIVDY